MTDETRPRKGMRWWMWVGGLALAVLAAVASLPLWGSGVAARLFERSFAQDRAGRLAIGALDLSWTGRQQAREVRLFDPEGGLVAEASLELPSLWALARGRGASLGAVQVTASADLVADDAGASNLERALAPRAPKEREPGAGQRGPGADGGGPREEGGAASGLDLVLELTCPRLTWSDQRTRALGAPFALRDVTGRAVLTPGQPVAVALDGAVAGGPSNQGNQGVLHVSAELRGLLDGGEPEGRVEARVEGLPSGLVDALAGLDGLLSSSLGETFELRARADGGLSEGSVSIDVRGGSGSLAFQGALRAGALGASGPDQGLDLRLGDPSALLARYAEPALPEGGALSASGLGLSLREFELPIPTGAFDPAAFLEGVRASFGLTLDHASLTLPGLAGGPLELAEVLFSAQVQPQQPLVLSLSSNLPAAAPGAAPAALDVQVDLLGLAALLPGAAPAAVERGWSARLRGQARGIETARVGALLGQQALVVDVLGATTSVRFSGVWPPSAEPLQLALESPGAELTFAGVIQDGVLVASGEQSLDAHLPLSPLVSQRIVGPLVPMMIDLQKPSGAAPLGLTVTEFRLPLDGDLSGLDASVSLALGDVAFELLPGLSDVLARLGQKNVLRTASLRPFALRIEQGVARYDGLPLTIQGRELLFKGAFDLARRELDFGADVPLALLGDGVARELDKVRKYLDPDLVVPVEVSGSWNAPRIGIARSFLDTTVKQAAEGALKQGLFDLLEKGLGKDR